MTRISVLPLSFMTKLVKIGWSLQQSNTQELSIMKGNMEFLRIQLEPTDYLWDWSGSAGVTENCYNWYTWLNFLKVPTSARTLFKVQDVQVTGFSSTDSPDHFFAGDAQMARRITAIDCWVDEWIALRWSTLRVEGAKKPSRDLAGWLCEIVRELSRQRSNSHKTIWLQTSNLDGFECWAWPLLDYLVTNNASVVRILGLVTSTNHRRAWSVNGPVYAPGPGLPHRSRS